MLELALNLLAVASITIGLTVLLVLAFGGGRPAKPKPVDVRLVMSAEFGGGWAFADTGTGRDALAEFYCEPPHALYPFGGEEGYIVEPWEARELLEHLKAEGCRVRVL